jgi:hypothetical protein
MTKIVCVVQLSVKVSKSHLSQSTIKFYLVWNLFLESQKKTAIELLKSCYFFPDRRYDLKMSQKGMKKRLGFAKDYPRDPVPRAKKNKNAFSLPQYV